MHTSSENRLPAFRVASLAVVAGFLASGLTACGDDDGLSGPDGAVSQAQAAKVAVAVNTALGEAFGAAAQQGGSAVFEPRSLVTAASSDASVRPAMVEWKLDHSTTCPQGGSVTMAGGGTIDTDEEAGSIAWSWTSDVGYDGCAVESDDGLFTLTTASPVEFTGSGQFTSDGGQGGSGSFAWDVTGTVQWDEEGGPSGTCDLDLSVSLEIDSSESSFSSTGSITGSICGHAVDDDWSGTITLGA